MLLLHQMQIYEKAYTYKIVCLCGCDECYYGSTRNIKRRMIEHKSVNRISFLSHGNYKYEIIDTFENITKDLLRKAEGEHIKNNNCINKRVAGRTEEEYYCENQDKIKNKIKEWFDNNKEKPKEYAKTYRTKNFEKLHQKITCVCGSVIVQHHKTDHEKTKKHINFISNANNI